MGYLCSDGFWDVVSLKKAVQLVHQVHTHSLEPCFVTNFVLFILSIHALLMITGKAGKEAKCHGCRREFS